MPQCGQKLTLEFAVGDGWAFGGDVEAQSYVGGGGV